MFDFCSTPGVVSDKCRMSEPEVAWSTTIPQPHQSPFPNHTPYPSLSILFYPIHTIYLFHPIIIYFYFV